METPESGFVENKGVRACKRIGAPQFPIGDDVSALHPLRSSVEVFAMMWDSPLSICEDDPKRVSAGYKIQLRQNHAN
jgi:hypothetical protein